MAEQDFYEPFEEKRAENIQPAELTYRELFAEDEDLPRLFADGLEELDTEVETGRKGSVEKLREFLQDPNNIYLVAFANGKVAGRIFGYIHDHPRGNRNIFIDEVDTLKKYRRRGVAKGMLEEMKKISQNLGSEEMWLGTEDDNKAAIALYRGLDPYEDYADRLFSYWTSKEKRK